jgi:hypothetical protein
MNALGDIIKRLETQKAAIEKALSALHEVAGGAMDDAPVAAPVTTKKRGRPAKRKGSMSPEGKARLVAALKKRWAAKKAAQETPVAKTAPAKATRKGHISEEGRKALAESMKRRWAREGSARCDTAKMRSVYFAAFAV